MSRFKELCQNGEEFRFFTKSESSFWANDVEMLNTSKSEVIVPRDWEGRENILLHHHGSEGRTTFPFYHGKPARRNFQRRKPVRRNAVSGFVPQAFPLVFVGLPQGSSEARGIIQFRRAGPALICSSHNQHSPAQPTMADAKAIQPFQVAETT